MDHEKIRRTLDDAESPPLFRALFSSSPSTTVVDVEEGCKANVIVDGDGERRTAIAEYTNAGTLCRFEVTNLAVVFSCYDLGDGRILLNQTQMPIEELLQPNPNDAISEFLERAQ